MVINMKEPSRQTTSQMAEQSTVVQKFGSLTIGRR